ncbi:MAG TPA: integrase arm-type DNA-binding domain-containing protein [Acidobacteriaceae bacterium]|nr:integrase arm-type DNA-binding domain-containing protein [Acidobacteriaceae bacterium]
MPTNLLSPIACKNAVSNGGSIRKMHDGEGLYLWVFPDGKRYWRLRYYWLGTEKSLSMGVYPRVSLKEARGKRDGIRQLLQAGKEPSAERKAEKRRKRLATANSFEAVALEWLEKQRNACLPKHVSTLKHRLEVDVFPALGDRPIAEIDAPELLAAMRTIESRGSFDLAHRVLQVCGQIFRYGIATGRCTRNLSLDLRGALTPHVKGQQNAVRPEELPALLKAIAGYDALGDRQTRLALQLLALTFVRTGELIGAEWSEIDVDNSVWTIPAERMKMKAEHLVPLSRQALALLAEMKPISGTSRFVFPGRNPSVPMSNNTMLFALYRLGFKGRMSGHGFRAVASTILNESGEWSADAIERQLAHCERNAVRGAYNRAEYLPERKRMMQWWGDYMDGVANGSK